MQFVIGDAPLEDSKPPPVRSSEQDPYNNIVYNRSPSKLYSSYSLRSRLRGVIHLGNGNMGNSTTSRLVSPIPLDPQQFGQLGARHSTDPLSRPGPPADAMTSAGQQTNPAAVILHLLSSNHPVPLTSGGL
ncbi:hypothetical protein G5714_015201 [Onychostoma macrolepis]|uniref:Uncharacterized protein n=1 Tax=Onychostoma macrolepis TaxID=369639 RepID=A0A7J6CB09_9TELE|nr:hypothetical protein G5714_015201 [Onychostoma macrolepis]